MTEHHATPTRAWEQLRDRLTNRRKADLLSQDDVAAEIGCARNTIGRVERGETVPDAIQLVAHAQALDMDVALVAPYQARLLALDNIDVVAILTAAACAHRRMPLSDAQQSRLAAALYKIRPRSRQGYPS